jgi:tetratricopeptide (TPR) repeat protein
MLLLLSGLWVSAFFPDKRLWGINHWAYFPFWLRTSVIVLGGLILIPVINSRFRSFLRQYVIPAFRWLMENRKRLGYPLVLAVSFVLFYLFRTRIPLLGDGFQITRGLAAGTLSVNWSQPLAIWVYLTSFHLLSGLFHLDAAAVYALVSYASGLIFVVFALRISMFLSRDWSTRLFVFLALMLMGGTQLFLGYAEHYPLLYSGILAYLFFGLKSLRGETSSMVPLGIFILLLPLHFSSLFLFPSALFLLLFVGKKGEEARVLKGKRIWLVSVLIVAIGAAVGFYVHKYSWYVFSYLMPVFHGGYTGPDYTLFSWSHLLDFLNQQLLVSPVGMVLLFVLLVFRPVPRAGKDRLFQFLLIASLGQLLFNFAINPGLGAPRDWDLFASAGLGYTLMALYLFSRAAVQSSTGYLKAGLITIALLFTLPWVVINASPELSVSRFRNLLDLDLRKSRNGHFILASYFDSIGKTEEVDRENRAIKENFPEVGYVNEGLSLLRRGEFPQAYAKINEAIRIAPGFGEAYLALGRYYVKTGDVNTAEAMFTKTLRLQPEDGSAYARLGDLYAQRGQLEKAKSFYLRSLRLGPADPEVLNNLAILYAQVPDLEKSASYYRKAIAAKESFVEAYYGLAFIRYRQGKLEESLEEINHLLKIKPDFPLAFQLRASVYEALGREQEAASARQRYLELQPNDP